MNPLFLYLLKASISLSIFFGFYALIYKREAFFNFNRAFLLFALLLAMVLPFINFNIFSFTGNEVQSPEDMLYYVQLPVFQLNEFIANGESFVTENISIISLFTYIYIAVVVFKLIHLFSRLIQISNISNRNKHTYHDGVQFVFISKDLPVFSFFNRIFIDEDTFNKQEAEKIIEHEKIHIKQFHSIDLLLAELVCVFQWFNPFAYFLKKAIKENHEFIVDQQIVSKQVDNSDYRLLLLEYATPIKTNILAHNFSYSLLKRRLQMMKKRKSMMRFAFNLFWILPVLLLVLFACSTPQEEQGTQIGEVTKNEKVQEDDLEKVASEASTDSSQVFKVVETQPEFPGGMSELYSYLGKSIKYPEQAKSDSIAGRVFVTFIVEKDGSITNVEVLRGIGGGCDEEAMRAIAEMPKWTPGIQRDKPVRVQYTLPIKFALK